MSIRLVLDKPYGEHAKGSIKRFPNMVAMRLIKEGIGHEAGGKEDAEAKAKADHEAAVAANAERDAALKDLDAGGGKKKAKKKKAKKKDKPAEA